MAPWSLALALFVSLLPEERRVRLGAALPLTAATTITGGLEWLGGLLLGAYLFMGQWDEQAAALLGATARLAGEGRVAVDRGALMGLGVAVFLRFLLSPGGLLSIFLFTEGLVRAIAGSAVGEPCASLPIWLVDRGGAAMHAWRARRRLPTLPDQVTVHGAPEPGVTIACCVARPWDAQSTIELDGALYGVAATEELAGADRPFVYHLRPIERWHLVRKVLRYDPPPG